MRLPTAPKSSEHVSSEDTAAAEAAAAAKAAAIADLEARLAAAADADKPALQAELDKLRPSNPRPPERTPWPPCPRQPDRRRVVFDTPAGLVPSVAEADPVTGARRSRHRTTLAALQGGRRYPATAAAAIQSAVEGARCQGRQSIPARSPAPCRSMVPPLAALEAFTQGVFIDPASGRLRVVLDALGGAQTLGTVTTVGQLAGVPANSVVYDVIDTAWANCLRGRIQ